jgi:hypothetical protein
MLSLFKLYVELTAGPVHMMWIPTPSAKMWIAGKDASRVNRNGSG